jgi:hypothetical protein
VNAPFTGTRGFRTGAGKQVAKQARAGRKRLPHNDRVRLLARGRRGGGSAILKALLTTSLEGDQAVESAIELARAVGFHAVDLDGLDFVPAHGAPAGGGHGVDESDFAGAGRLIFGAKGGDENVKIVVAFGAKERGFGEQSVTQRIAGGPSLSFRCYGTGGLQRVSAVSAVTLRLSLLFIGLSA